jgi:hypothetical protein
MNPDGRDKRPAKAGWSRRKRIFMGGGGASSALEGCGRAAADLVHGCSHGRTAADRIHCCSDSRTAADRIHCCSNSRRAAYGATAVAGGHVFIIKGGRRPAMTV